MDSTSGFKPLSSLEVALIAQELQTLVGAQFQEFVQMASDQDSEIGLGFYHKSSVLWLWFALRPSVSIVVRRHDKPPGKKLQRPLTLFLRSRFLGRRLAAVRVLAEFERVLVFSFHRGKDEDDASPCEIEVRLLPHGQNVIARDGERAVSEFKPKDLPIAVSPPTVGEAHSGLCSGLRSWGQIEDEWRALNQPRVETSAAAVPALSKRERQWKKELEKKEKILQRLEEEIKTKSSSDYSELGEWLKVHPIHAVPEKWRELVNHEKTLYWNIDECFRRAKENARKLNGTRARFAVVTKELLQLRQEGPSAEPSRAAQKARSENLLVRGEARGRRFQVAVDLEAFIGKSAEDNLRILRKAQPFDFWMHLRERPGSHAILRRTRGRIVSDAEFLKVGVWVAEQSLKKRASEIKGERYDLLIVECRFVRPIKGDKLGRVHYTHDRVMTIRF